MPSQLKLMLQQREGSMSIKANSADAKGRAADLHRSECNQWMTWDMGMS